MKNFILLYRGGNAPEDKQQESMQEWGEFIKQMGDAMKSGQPFAGGKIVSENSVEDYKAHQDDISGYTEIAVDSIDVALKIAKMAPHLKYGGTVELREVMDMPGM